jgi:hypothetical protein
MKTIGINIDGVLRNFLDKFDKQYRRVFIHNPSLVAMNEKEMTVKEFTEQELEEIDKKIEEKTAELITLPLDSFDLLNHYKFESKKIEMTAEKFLIHDGQVYENAPQEAMELTPDQCLNSFMYEEYALQIFAQADEYENAMEFASKIQAIGLENKSFNVVLLSTCKKKAIPATYSFLALKGCKIKGVLFVEEDYEKWKHCDILIDVMPESFQTKPEGKISIKINQDFNKWDEADYSLDHIKDVYKKEFLQTITK